MNVSEADDFLSYYNHDRNAAKEDGAEREFLEAEAIVQEYEINNYDNFHN